MRKPTTPEKTRKPIDDIDLSLYEVVNLGTGVGCTQCDFNETNGGLCYQLGTKSRPLFGCSLKIGYQYKLKEKKMEKVGRCEIIFGVDVKKKETIAKIIPEGQYFTGTIAGYDDVLFLRSHECVIGLGSCKHWDECVPITGYRPVSVIIEVCDAV